jgi:hypothetical protein
MHYYKHQISLFSNLVPRAFFENALSSNNEFVYWPFRFSDVTMSILETLNDTIGNIVYGLKNRFDQLGCI